MSDERPSGEGRPSLPYYKPYYLRVLKYLQVLALQVYIANLYLRKYLYLKISRTLLLASTCKYVQR